jgi:hypothetical protein
MDKKQWADEMVRLYFEGYSLDQARRTVKKMMKEARRIKGWK